MTAQILLRLRMNPAREEHINSKYVTFSVVISIVRLPSAMLKLRIRFIWLLKLHSSHCCENTNKS